MEGPARRSAGLLTGRTCHNKRVLFAADAPAPASLAAFQAGAGSAAAVQLQAGDYAAVEVVSAGVQTLNVRPLARTTAGEFLARFGSTLPGSVACGSAADAQRIAVA